MLNILVGCEESGTVTAAFRRAGFEAYSCDLQATRGNPDWHYQDDITRVIPSRHWDLIVLHPPCTALAVSGNRWYAPGKPRHAERLAAIEWTVALWNLAIQHADRVALENPKSAIFRHLNAGYQIIHPWQFGHGEKKETALALHRLPPLQATQIVEERRQTVWFMGPSLTRARDRSVTFTGIAEAMAHQWGRQIRQSQPARAA